MLRQDRGSSIQLWIWKLGLISDLRTSELLPCSPSHTLAPPQHHTLLIWGGGAGIPGHPGTLLQVSQCISSHFYARPSKTSPLLQEAFLCQRCFFIQPSNPESPSLRAAARRVISLPASAPAPCLFSNCGIWDVPLLFTPGVTSIYSQPIRVQMGSSRLQTETWRVRVRTLAYPSSSHLPAFTISAVLLPAKAV